MTGVTRWRARPRLAAAVVAASVALTMTLVLAGVALARIATGAYGATGDFISFWSAGYIVRTGEGARLYDPGLQELVERAHFAAGFDHYYGYVLPAFAAWMFAPLSLLPFRAATFVWMGCNVALLAIAARMLARELTTAPAAARRTSVAVFVASMPSVAVVLFGQVDLIVMLGAFLSYLLLRRDRDAAAGAALSLMLFKPQMLGGVVLMLIVIRRWRALATLAAIGVPLLTLPALTLGPRTLVDNAGLIGRFPSAGTDMSVNAPLMSNWRGFVVSATGRDDVWLWLPGLALIAVAAIAIAWPRWRRAWRTGASFDQAYALAVMAPLLASPHLHTQSLVLMFVAVALYMRAWSDARIDGQRPAGDGRPATSRRGHQVAGAPLATPSLDAPPACEMEAIVLLLWLFAALFALWFSGAVGLSLMVFLIAAVYWRLAFRWPSRVDPIADDVRLPRHPQIERPAPI